MGDFSIHRLRIGSWVPSPIKSITTDPSSYQLAVGRENGDIDIYDASNHQKFFCTARIAGMKGFQLQCLVWTPSSSSSCYHDDNEDTDKELQPSQRAVGRLFGISLRGFLFEVDLSLLQIVSIMDTYGGSAWCMAASPRESALALGCEDGTIRLYLYSSMLHSSSGVMQETVQKSLEYSKSLPTAGARVLSIAYHPTEPRLFAGSSDGTIRCLDEKSGRVLFRMLGDVMRGSIGVQIWTLCVMADSTVVSGDSRGQLQLWDGATGVLMDTFRQHSADVLALVVSPGEREIFASGVDGKVVCLQRSQCGEGSGSSAASSAWIYVHAHRAHSHDVFSLAVVPVKRAGSGLDDELVLLSGGVEGRLSTYAVDSFVRVRPTWIPAIPTQSLTSCSLSREVIAVRHSEYVDVWQLQYLRTTTTVAADPSTQLGVVASDPNCQLHSRLVLRGDHHLHCCGLAPSGDVVALSSASGLRIYQLPSMGGGEDNDAGGAGDDAKKIVVPSIINAPGEFVQAVAFVDRRRRSNRAVSPHALSSSKINNKKREVVDGAAVMTTNSLPLLMMAVYCAKKGSIYLCELASTLEDKDDDEDVPAAGGALSGERLLCSIHCELLHHLSVRSSSSSSSSPIGGAGVDPLDLAVRKMVFSGPDSDYLAVLSCGSTSGVFVYSVGNKQLHWILPTDTQLVTDIAFLCRSTAAAAAPLAIEAHGSKTHPTSSSSLVCITASNCFHVFDVDQLKLGPEYSVPRSIRDMSAPICGVSVLEDQQQMIMYGQGYCVFVDLSLLSPAADGGCDSMVSLALGDASSKLLLQSSLSSSSSSSFKHTKKQRRGDLAAVEDEDGEGEGEQEGMRKRKGEGEGKGRKDSTSSSSTSSRGFVVFNKYRNLLQVAFKSSNELVVIENPWTRIMSALPDTLHRKRYGT